jgi:hypothetical protein
MLSRIELQNFIKKGIEDSNEGQDILNIENQEQTQKNQQKFAKLLYKLFMHLLSNYNFEKRTNTIKFIVTVFEIISGSKIKKNEQKETIENFYNFLDEKQQFKLVFMLNYNLNGRSDRSEERV